MENPSDKKKKAIKIIKVLIAVTAVIIIIKLSYVCLELDEANQNAKQDYETLRLQYLNQKEENDKQLHVIDSLENTIRDLNLKIDPDYVKHSYDSINKAYKNIGSFDNVIVND